MLVEDCDYRDAPKNISLLICFLEDLHLAHPQEGELMVATMGWSLLWTILLATNTQVQVDAWSRKLKR